MGQILARGAITGILLGAALGGQGWAQTPPLPTADHINTIPASALMQVEVLASESTLYGARRPVAELEVEAARGDVKAMNGLGNKYAHGIDVAKDESKAVALYRKAMDADDDRATLEYAGLLANGLGVAADVKEARRLREGMFIRTKGECCIPQAMAGVFRLFWDEPKDVPPELQDLYRHDGPDPEKLKARAAAGDASAMETLSADYAQGRWWWGVKQDAKLAEYWAFQAADHGSAYALYAIGGDWRLEQSDPAKAFMFVQRAAELGDIRAMVEMARKYVVGGYVAKDEAKAIGWIERAFAAGDLEGPVLLTHWYNGPFLPRQPEKAVALLKRIATSKVDGQWHEEQEAFERLIKTYETGDLVPADAAQTTQWRAALDQFQRDVPAEKAERNARETVACKARDARICIHAMN